MHASVSGGISCRLPLSARLRGQCNSAYGRHRRLGLWRVVLDGEEAGQAMLAADIKQNRSGLTDQRRP